MGFPEPKHLTLPPRGPASRSRSAGPISAQPCMKLLVLPPAPQWWAGQTASPFPFQGSCRRGRIVGWRCQGTARPASPTPPCTSWHSHANAAAGASWAVGCLCAVVNLACDCRSPEEGKCTGSVHLGPLSRRRRAEGMSPAPGHRPGRGLRAHTEQWRSQSSLERTVRCFS